MNITPIKVILPVVEFDNDETELVIDFLRTDALDIYAKCTKKNANEIADKFGEGELICRLAPDSWSVGSAISFEKKRVIFVPIDEEVGFDATRPVFSLNAIQQHIHRNRFVEKS